MIRGEGEEGLAGRGINECVVGRDCGGRGEERRVSVGGWAGR